LYTQYCNNRLSITSFLSIVIIKLSTVDLCHVCIALTIIGDSYHSSYFLMSISKLALDASSQDYINKKTVTYPVLNI